MWGRGAAAKEHKDRITQRKLLTRDLSNCNQQQFTRSFDYQMCLFRSEKDYECKKPAKKLAAINEECKIIKARIEELDREIFPPTPGKK